MTMLLIFLLTSMMLVHSETTANADFIPVQHIAVYSTSKASQRLRQRLVVRTGLLKIANFPINKSTIITLNRIHKSRRDLNFGNVCLLNA